jgi:hypothetical protein
MGETCVPEVLEGLGAACVPALLTWVVALACVPASAFFEMPEAVAFFGEGASLKMRGLATPPSARVEFSTAPVEVEVEVEVEADVEPVVPRAWLAERAGLGGLLGGGGGREARPLELAPAEEEGCCEVEPCESGRAVAASLMLPIEEEPWWESGRGLGDEVARGAD